jgi:BirA family biotin operon repressor/biotin-[acetyl-CoA-carboxylase] ligase
MFAGLTVSLPPDLAHALSSAHSRLGNFAALRYIEEVGSTNDVALSLASQGVAEGTSVLADWQTAGRGRRGRQWDSPPGAGLYLSVVLTADDLGASLSLVTLTVGVAVAKAIVAVTGLPIELKWPNDVVIGRPWRKMAGILCESAAVGNSGLAIVAGIGVNLTRAAYPSAVADYATSIEMELGRTIDRAPLVIECLAQLRDAVSRLRHGSGRDIGDEWRRFGRAALDGAPVRWHDAGGERRGLARDIADDGALLVECGGGMMERIVAGEVIWERMS